MGLFRSSVKFGSIRPVAHKQESLRSRIMPTPLPETLELSLQQHQGPASIPCVEVGDRVLKYQLLANPADERGVPLHAPTSGSIESIDKTIQPIQGSDPQQAIVLRCDMQDESVELEPVWDFRTLKHDQLIDKLERAGLCGMGGAGFPTAAKIKRAVEAHADTLIINAAECEPYITCDEALIRERADSVIRGAEILQAASVANRCVIGIESDKREAIAALREQMNTDSIELKLLAPRYPAGDESQLVYAITGREAPESGLPLDVGVLVVNAGTAAAAYDAVVRGQPCINRITTLTGSALQTPKNFEVPIGTPITHLLNLCGVDSKAHHSTILGGSLMGKPVNPSATVIKKTNHCVIAATCTDIPSREAELPCIRCGFCANVCPSHLLPQQLLYYSKQEDFESLVDHGLTDCIECGACAYVCPSKIPLVQYYRESKDAIRLEQNEMALGDRWQARFQYLQYRRKRAAAESNSKKHSAKTSTKKNSVESNERMTAQFSREQAKSEIAAAVARVKRKKSGDDK